MQNKNQNNPYGIPAPAQVLRPSVTPPQGRTRGWTITLVILAVANLLTIVIPNVAVMLPIWDNVASTQGMDTIILLMFPAFTIGYLVALLNIVLLTIYIVTRRPQVIGRVAGLLVVVLSGLYLGWTVFNYFNVFRMSQQNDTPVSRQEALDLIDTCKVELLSKGGEEVYLGLKYDAAARDPSEYSRYAAAADFEVLKDEALKVEKNCGKIEIIEY